MVGRYASRIAPILAIALLSGVFCLAVPAAINAQAPPTQMDVDGLKDAARSERQSAAERADKARRWRGLAKAAREAADKALDDRDRKRWEKSAAEREATAKKLEQDAKELIEAAKKKEAKAAELQEDVSARKQAEDREKAQTKKQDEEIARKLAEEAAAKPAFRMSVEDTIGVWRSKDTDAIFVIVQEDPNRQVYGYRLEAHTKNRAWKGEYEPFDAGDSRRVENARLTFKYKPKAEEINPKIPLWARKAVAGTLEWRIELNESGDEVNPVLKGVWYPGEVHWRDSEDGETGTAWVEGKGAPRKVQLEPEVNLQFVMLESPLLTVKLPGPHDPLTHPIQGLTKGQPFLVRVALPPEMAEKQGKTLDVTMRGLSGGSSDKITLSAEAASERHLVIYSHADPITIADDIPFGEPARNPQFLSLQYLFQGIPGSRLNLAVKNGELVEFRVGEGYETIPVYDSWVQRGLSRHKQGEARLRAIYKSVILDNKKDKEIKERAQKRLRMLDNYLKIFSSDKLTDVHRYHLGERYIADGTVNTGLVNLTDTQIQEEYRRILEGATERQRDLTFFNSKLKIFLEELTGKNLTPGRGKGASEGIVWTSEAEKWLVREAIAAASNRLEANILKRTVREGTFALYDGTVSALPQVTGVKLFLTKRDHFNKRVRPWQRVHAVLGLASGATLSLASSRLAQAYLSRIRFRSPFSKGLILKGSLQVHLGKVLRETAGAIFKRDLPRSLNKRQRDQTRLRFTPDDKYREKTIGCARTWARKRSSGDVASGSGRLGAPGSAELAAQRKYVSDTFGSDAEILSLNSSHRFGVQQQPGTCSILSTSYLIFKNTGKFITENAAMSIVWDVMLDMTKRGLINGSELLKSYHVLGYPARYARHYARAMGAKVATIPRADNRFVKVRTIEGALRGGYDVLVGLKVPNGFHAVTVEKIIRNKAGNISKVVIYDPNVSGLIKMSAVRFKRMLPILDNVEFNILTLFKWPKLQGS